MAALTNLAANKLIDALLRGQALGAPGTLWAGLFTTMPTDAAAGGVEPAVGAYARQSIVANLGNWFSTQGVAGVASTGVSKLTSNAGLITFPAPTADWGTIVGVGLFDAVTAGNLWVFDLLSAAWVVKAGDPAPAFGVSALSFALVTHAPS